MPLPLPRIAAFATIALALHVGLSALYVATVGVEHRVRVYDRAFLESDTPVEVMFAGASHTRFGIDARLLPRTANISVPGEHYIKVYYRVKWLLDHTDHPVHTVVLPLEPASFSSWKTGSYRPDFIWGQYVDFIELGARKGEPVAYGTRLMKRWLWPYVGELETWLGYFEGGRAFAEPPGWRAYGMLSASDRYLVAAQKIEDHFVGSRLDDPDELWAFRALHADLVARGIKPVYVSYPLTGPYVAHSDRLGIRQASRERVIEPLVEDLDLVWLDYSDHFEDTPTLFIDSDHLNVIGRTRFTLTLGEELQRLQVYSGPAE